MSIAIAQLNHQLMMQDVFKNQPLNLNKENQVNQTNHSFATMFMDQLNKTNELQKVADVETEKFIMGESDNMHDVMIAMEEAKLALELTTQVRNKMIDVYSELKSMQI